MNSNIDEISRIEELCHRQIALADFIGANPKSVRLINESLGVFSAFDDSEAFLVTPGFLQDCLPIGEKYGYHIYLLNLSNPATHT